MTEETSLTTALLKCKSGEFDLESIHTLDLSHMDLTSLGCLSECSGLERLDLSFNDLTKLYALAGLTNLTDLNLAANRITTLDGLQSLDNLRSLNLSGNLIGSIETLQCLSSLEKLSTLRLKDDLQQLSNPLCMNTSYKQDVLSVLPNLVTLDDERLKGHGKELVKLCSQLDSMFSRTDVHVTLPSSDTHWLPEDFWSKEQQTNEVQQQLTEAEQQLEDLLAECKDLCSVADKKLTPVLCGQDSRNSLS